MAQAWFRYGGLRLEEEKESSVNNFGHRCNRLRKTAAGAKLKRPLVDKN